MNYLSYKESTYIISGVGRATTYDDVTNDRIYTVSLVKNNSKIVYAKVLSVNDILSCKVWGGNININP